MNISCELVFLRFIAPPLRATLTAGLAFSVDVVCFLFHLGAVRIQNLERMPVCLLRHGLQIFGLFSKGNDRLQILCSPQIDFECHKYNRFNKFLITLT